MDLTTEQIEWIQANHLFFTSSYKLDKNGIIELFKIYSHITEKEQKPTSCGRCIMSARNRVWAQYVKQHQ